MERRITLSTDDLDTITACLEDNRDCAIDSLRDIRLYGQGSGSPEDLAHQKTDIAEQEAYIEQTGRLASEFRERLKTDKELTSDQP